ncbi:MAG: hypothetical protein AB7U82_21695 [Blastocatellales bacterium]
MQPWSHVVIGAKFIAYGKAQKYPINSYRVKARGRRAYACGAINR